MFGVAVIVVLHVVAKDAPSETPSDVITRAIRAQVGAKHTAKQIDDARRDADCDPTTPRCAAEVGKALGAELAITGELERRGTHETLVLSLVDVKTKQRVRSVRQVSGGDMKKLARSAYLRLVAEDLGQLAIIANAQQGEVMIDGQVAAGLFEGKTTISGLAKGSHLLSIRARGYKPLDVDVTVETSTKQMLLLDPETP